MKKILIVFILLLFTACTEKETVLKSNEVNLNDLVIEDKIFYNISTTNTSVIYDSGLTTFKTTLNCNVDELKLNIIKVIFKTKNNNIITTLEGYINKELIKSESLDITITSDINLTNAYSIEYSFE